MKDLNIPWSKLFTPSDPPRTESHPASRHTALSTLLMDDSPRKAELQPYNHLCVKEYSNVVRNRDLAALLEEKTRVKSSSFLPPTEELEPQSLLPPPPPQLPLIPSTVHHQHPTRFDLPPAPIDPTPDFQFDQSVGIQPGATLLNPLPPFTSNAGSYPQLPGDSGLGHGVIAPQMLFKNPSPSIIGYQNPQAFQPLSPSISPFASSQQPHHSQSHWHPPATEASAQPIPSTPGSSLDLTETTTEEVKHLSDPPPSTSTSKKRKREDKWEAEHKASRVGSILEIEYDETLLAVIGILDEAKHQSNIASWVKANGFWGPYPHKALVNLSTDALTHDRFRNGDEDIAVLSDSGSVSSGRHGDRKKKRGDAIADASEASVVDRPEDGGSTYPETNERENQTNASETPLWFDHPLAVQHWVDRGRKALQALGIPIEHGLKQ